MYALGLHTPDKAFQAGFWPSPYLHPLGGTEHFAQPLYSS